MVVPEIFMDPLGFCLHVLLGAPTSNSCMLRVCRVQVLNVSILGFAPGGAGLIPRSLAQKLPLHDSRRREDSPEPARATTSA